MAKRAYIAAPGATLPMPGTAGLAGPARFVPHEVSEAVWADEQSEKGRRFFRWAQRGEAIDVTDRVAAARSNAPPARNTSKNESKGSG